MDANSFIASLKLVRAYAFDNLTEPTLEEVIPFIDSLIRKALNGQLYELREVLEEPRPGFEPGTSACPDGVPGQRSSQAELPRHEGI